MLVCTLYVDVVQKQQYSSTTGSSTTEVYESMLGTYTYYTFDGNTFTLGRRDNCSKKEHIIGIKDVSTRQYIGTLHTDSTFKANSTSNPQYYKFTYGGAPFSVSFTGLGNRDKVNILYNDGTSYDWKGMGKTVRTVSGTTTYTWKNI